MNKDMCEINFIGLTHDHTYIQDNVVELAADCENNALNGQAAKSEPQQQQQSAEELCSAISILKRHPMYDCLVLVKKYRRCLEGYALEFPIDRIRENERIPTNESAKHTAAGHEQQEGSNNNQQADDKDDESRTGPSVSMDAKSSSGNLSACSQRRLVSRFLDGDDPMYSPALLYTMSSQSISTMQDSGDDDSSSHRHQQHPHVHQLAGDKNNLDADNEATITNENENEHEMVTAECVQLPFMEQIDDNGEQCNLVHVPVNGLLDRLELYTRNGIAVDSRVYAFAMGLKTAERMMTTKSMKELQETPI